MTGLIGSLVGAATNVVERLTDQFSPRSGGAPENHSSVQFASLLAAATAASGAPRSLTAPGTSATTEAATEEALEAELAEAELELSAEVLGLETPPGLEVAGAAGPEVRRVDRNLAQLQPEFRSRLERVMERMEAEFGHTVHIVEAHRSQERQNYLYEQGRTRPGGVVTWTRNSNHTRGRAVDVMIDGTYNNPTGYARLATIAAEEGLRTLGPRDPGHIELPRGIPGGLAGENYAFSDGQAEAVGGAFGVAAARGTTAGAGGIARVASLARVAQVAQVARVAQVAHVARPGAPAAPGAPVEPREVPTGGEPTPAPDSLLAPAFLAATDAAALGRSGGPISQSNRSATLRAAEVLGSIDVARLGDAARPTAAPTPTPLESAVAAVAAQRSPTGGEAGFSGGGRRGSEDHESSQTQTAELDGARSDAGHGRAGTTNSPVGEARFATGSEAVQRAAQILALKEGAASGPVNHLLLRMDSPGGGEDRIRVDLRGTTVGATVSLENAAEAERLGARIGELRQSLERQGLDADTVRIRTTQPGSDRHETARGAFAAAEVEVARPQAGSRSGSDSHSSREGFREPNGQLKRDANDSKQRSRREPNQEDKA